MSPLDSDKAQRSSLIRYTLLALLLWTAAVAGSLWWNIHAQQQKSLDLAKTAALSDMAFGIWAAAHGGIYVSPDANASLISGPTRAPNHDVVTTEGKRLTAVDPNYPQHQVIGQNTLLAGASGRLTSLQLADPINRPDAWEARALESFRQGAKEATTLADIDGKPQFRVIHPLVMGRDCLKCHAATGVNLGQVRGGVSVSIPLEPIYAASRPQVQAIRLVHAGAWLLGAGLIGFVAVVGERESAGRLRLERAEELAGRDSLTGLYHHRKFYALLGRELARAQRYDHPVSLLMLDIDHFKTVNDTHGHLAGDAILRDLAELLVKQARAIDRVCRYGGEEFTVILPETEGPVAVNIAERLRGVVERKRFDIGGAESASITVSIGVSTYPRQAVSAEALVDAADVALYAAKDAGRNRTRQLDGGSEAKRA